MVGYYTSVRTVWQQWGGTRKERHKHQNVPLYKVPTNTTEPNSHSSANQVAGFAGGGWGGEWG